MLFYVMAYHYRYFIQSHVVVQSLSLLASFTLILSTRDVAGIQLQLLASRLLPHQLALTSVNINHL
jgi:hypothetical protein